MRKRYLKRTRGGRTCLEFLESRCLMSAVLQMMSGLGSMDSTVAVASSNSTDDIPNSSLQSGAFGGAPAVIPSDSPVSPQPAPEFDLDDPDSPESHAAVQSWVDREQAFWNQVAQLPLTPVDVVTPATPPPSTNTLDLSEIRREQMLTTNGWIVPLSRANGIAEIQFGSVHDFRPGAQNNHYVAAAILQDSAGHVYSMESCQFVDTGDGGYNIYVRMNVPDSAVLGNCQLCVRYGPNVDGTDAAGGGGLVTFAEPGHPADGALLSPIPAADVVTRIDDGDHFGAPELVTTPLMTPAEAIATAMAAIPETEGQAVPPQLTVGAMHDLFGSDFDAWAAVRSGSSWKDTLRGFLTERRDAAQILGVNITIDAQEQAASWKKVQIKRVTVAGAR